MKLQLALDLVDTKGALEVLEDLHDVIDIVEVGTPLIVREGVHAVEAIKKKYPNLTVLADLKIIDGGEEITEIALEKNADIVTVLGVSDNITISGCVSEAKKFGKEVLVDMMAIENIAERATEIDKLGVDYICVHTADDVQITGKNPLHELQILKSIVKNAKLAVAGGINISSIDSIVAEGPEIVIVGGGIAAQDNMREAAVAIRSRLK
jgi:3-hexulose-6-phosphate synthase